MKPSRTYKSLAAIEEKIKFALLLFLIGQIFYLSFSNMRIPLPPVILDKIIENIDGIPPGFSIHSKGSSLHGFSELHFNELGIYRDNEIIANLHNLEIHINPELLAGDHSPPFLSLFLTKGSIILKTGTKELANFKNIAFEKNRGSNYQLSADVDFAGHEIRFHGCFDLSHNSVHRKNSDEKILEVLDQAEKLLVELEKQNEFIPRTKFNAFANWSNNSLSLKLNQVDDTDDHFIKGLSLTSTIELCDPPKAQVVAKADSIKLSNSSIDSEFLQPRINLFWKFSPKNNSSLPKHCRASFKQVKLNGIIEGTMPSFDIETVQDSNQINVQVFSHSDVAQTCLHSIWKDLRWKHQGFVDIRPELFDLKAKLPQGTLRILDGKKLQIRISENHSPMVSGGLTQFSVLAHDFSSLETPRGQFRLLGELSKDGSIYVNDAYGKFGRSEAKGSYKQTWNPAEFRFLVKGTCFPPDIANWLGTWWMPIWKEFSFKEEAPVGDFSITGIWGGEPGTSRTVGSVQANNISYQDFSITESEIVVMIDEKSTDLYADKISHSAGQIEGCLFFPHKKLNSPLNFKFRVSGDFPFDDAKSILGPTAEKSLNNLKAPLLKCEGSGAVYKTLPEPLSDVNLTSFTLGINSSIPTTYSGIPIQSLSGTIERQKGILKGFFPRIEMAEGEGAISFEEISRESDLVKIHFNMDGANRVKLIDAIEHAKLMEASKDENPSLNKTPMDSREEENNLGGKLNISFTAEGPISDPMQFVGSGISVLTDVEIGSINFLGGIRSKLGAFNLPLPSDALSFNRLEAPFFIDHQFLRFDEINLSGPLSLLVANGDINLETKEVNLIADLKLAGNLKIPLVKQLINLADPLPKMTSIKIAGPWANPAWQIHLTPGP